jgi:hypothetical protein
MFEVVVDSWNQWARSTRGTKAMRAWGARDPALEGWPIAELRAPVASTRTDAMQAALVALAQEHETMAATTLAVQLRPGLTRVVRLALAGGCWVTGPDDAPYHVLGVFYETLMRHPLERRPTKIAANLVQDTRQRIWRTSDGPRAKGLPIPPCPPLPRARQGSSRSWPPNSTRSAFPRMTPSRVDWSSRPTWPGCTAPTCTCVWPAGS